MKGDFAISCPTEAGIHKNGQNSAGIWKSLHNLCRDLKKPAQIEQGFVNACSDCRDLEKSAQNMEDICAAILKSLHKLGRDV